MPRARSEIELHLARRQIDASVENPDENILDVTTSEGGTVLRVAGVGGETGLLWHDRKSMEPVIEARSSIDIRILENQLELTANVTVQSYGVPMEEFLVSLPEGMQLLPQPQTDLRIVKTAEDPRNLRVVRSDGSSTYEFNLTLVLRQDFDGALDKPLQIEGFSVVGAERQSGSIEVTVEGDRRVEWTPLQRIKRVPRSSNLVPEDEESESARFSFFGQPFLLQVSIRPQESTVRAEPSYLLDFQRDQIYLTASIRYQVGGRPIDAVEIELPGWIVDNVTPDEIVGAEFDPASTAPLKIPLSENVQSATGNFEIKISAHRPYENNSQVSVNLPQPLSVADAAFLTVLSADNVQLTPAELHGLQPESQGVVPTPSRRQQPLFYREEVAGTNQEEASVFSTEVAIRQQAVEYQVEAAIRIEATEIFVSQRFLFNVEYEPLQRVNFIAPADIALDTLQVLLDGVRLPTTPESTRGESTFRDSLPQNGATSVSVELLEDKIGNVELEAKYSVSFAPPPPEATIDLSIPILTCDSEETFRSRGITVQLGSTSDWDAVIIGDEWNAVPRFESELAVAEILPTYRSESISKLIDIRLVAAERERFQARLRAVWIQSWLNGSIRRDRACFRLLTSEPRIKIEIPASAIQLDELQIAVDGKATPYVPQERTITIDLSQESDVAERTIELWYWIDGNEIPLRTITVDPPRIEGVDLAKRVFWQLVSPRTEHLLLADNSLTPEFVWQWTSRGWRRESNRNEETLEALMGASRQVAIPQEMTSQYLFSSSGQLKPVTFVIASRWFLVSISSGVTLCIGLLILHVKALRHPSFLLVFGVCLLAIAAVTPDFSMLLGQAAIGGLLLLVASRLLHLIAAFRFPERRSSLSGESHRSTRLEPSEESKSRGSSRLSTRVTASHYPLPAAGQKP